MPTTEHDLWLTLFDEAPALLGVILESTLGLDLAGARYEPVRDTYATIRPPTYAADRVFHVMRGDVIVLALIVEAQRAIDAEKRASWPHYVVHEMRRTKVPVELLIVTDDRNVAAWARAPIPIGLRGGFFAPLVLGPGSLPLERDLDRALVHPATSFLAALLEERPLDREEARAALHAAVHVVGKPDATLYVDALLEKHPSSIRAILEELMPSPSRFEIKDDRLREILAVLEARGEARGIAVGEARGEARGIAVGEARAEQRVHTFAIHAVRDLCTVLGIPVDETRAARIESKTTDELEALRLHLVEARRWPEE